MLTDLPVRYSVLSQVFFNGHLYLVSSTWAGSSIAILIKSLIAATAVAAKQISTVVLAVSVVASTLVYIYKGKKIWQDYWNFPQMSPKSNTLFHNLLAKIPLQDLLLTRRKPLRQLQL